MEISQRRIKLDSKNKKHGNKEINRNGNEKKSKNKIEEYLKSIEKNKIDKKLENSFDLFKNLENEKKDNPENVIDEKVVNNLQIIEKQNEENYEIIFENKKEIIYTPILSEIESDNDGSIILINVEEE